MGVEVLVIAVVSGVISLASAVTSIGTLFHLKQHFVSSSNDATHVNIENHANEKTEPNGIKEITKKQKIYIKNIDNDFVSHSKTATRTGLPNKVAEQLAVSGPAILDNIVPGNIAQEAVDITSKTLLKPMLTQDDEGTGANEENLASYHDRDNSNGKIMSVYSQQRKVPVNNDFSSSSKEPLITEIEETIINIEEANSDITSADLVGDITADAHNIS
jgi:hypothetical protein